ncbi:MAG: TonB-system energizer ExbB [Sphaerochaetaceae bacterium]
MKELKFAVDYGVIGILAVMSVIAVAIAIERWFVLRKIRVEDFRNRKELELVITQKIHVIATIGANSPYVGLLGTILGIMLTFYTMGEKGIANSTDIMIGLALALKATAAGILVAIPSIVLYNMILRKVKVLLLKWDIAHG